MEEKIPIVFQGKRGTLTFVSSLGQGSMGVVGEYDLSLENTPNYISSKQAIKKIPFKGIYSLLMEMKVASILDYNICEKKNILIASNFILGDIAYELDSFHKMYCHLIGKIKQKIRIDDTFLVYKFMHFSLFDCIKRRWEYSIEWKQKEVLKLSMDILKALDYIHTNEIIHGDLHFNNIMNNYEKDSWFLIDFGNSLIIPKDKTKRKKETFNLVPSTFRSVNIFEGNYPYGYEIDLYAFGCLIYEIMTDERLFNEKEEEDLIQSKKLFNDTFIIKKVSQKKTKFSKMKNLLNSSDYIEKKIASLIVSLLDETSNYNLEDNLPVIYNTVSGYYYEHFEKLYYHQKRKSSS